jgi:hypothetical protein
LHSKGLAKKKSEKKVQSYLNSVNENPLVENLVVKTTKNLRNGPQTSHESKEDDEECERTSKSKEDKQAKKPNETAEITIPKTNPCTSQEKELIDEILNGLKKNSPRVLKPTIVPLDKSSNNCTVQGTCSAAQIDKLVGETERRLSKGLITNLQSSVYQPNRILPAKTVSTSAIKVIYSFFFRLKNRQISLIRI